MRKNRRGFTLIELMVVVGIVGVLASIAIPEYQLQAMRSKLAERPIIMGAIAQSLLVNIGTTGELPPTLTYNPPFSTLGPTKRAFRDLPNWERITGLPIGTVYHSYLSRSTGTFRNGCIWIFAIGDLDGNGVYGSRRIAYCNDAASTTFEPDPNRARELHGRY